MAGERERGVAPTTGCCTLYIVIFAIIFLCFITSLFGRTTEPVRWLPSRLHGLQHVAEQSEDHHQAALIKTKGIGKSRITDKISCVPVPRHFVPVPRHFVPVPKIVSEVYSMTILRKFLKVKTFIAYWHRNKQCYDVKQK